MGNALYVGADDSNHAGQTKGEIIVAVFSTLHDDSLVKNFGNKRNYSKIESLMTSPHRDYRFTVCTNEEFRHSNQNLPLVVPYLIDNFLDSTGTEFDKICVYLDGRLSGVNKRKMRSELQDTSGTNGIVVDNFIKKQNSDGKFHKGYHCPRLVWIADGLANHLFRSGGSPLELFSHEKMVGLGF